MHVGAGAACVTVNVRLAIVTVPDRAAPVLAAIAIETAPLPLPLAPEVTVIHGALLTAAVQLQPAGAVTETGAIAPPAAATASLARLMSYVHVGAGGGGDGEGGAGAGGAGGCGAGGCGDGAVGDVGFAACCWLTV